MTENTAQAHAKHELFYPGTHLVFSVFLSCHYLEVIQNFTFSLTIGNLTGFNFTYRLTIGVPISLAWTLMSY